ncbi:unnamed protein product [Rotaria sordida]|uniref:Mixed lineage kinase domain-containing protein n=1 Tax=Rotaria sordida TaxID=392033 RepID=A0A818PAM0_9BILA|nr:unnamed protein product [Rotaria sordida]
MDMPGSSAMDTISVAMTSLPKSIPVLSNIYKLSTDIRETAERVEVNKQQCGQLSERIDILIGFLAQRDLSDCLNEAMHRALHRFETFLRQCLDFISTFIEASWFKRIVNNKDYEKKFLDLNRELTQYSNDLNFGIGLSNIQKNKEQNNNARADIESDESDKFENNFPQRKTFEMADDDQHIGITSWETSRKTNNVPHMSAARTALNFQQAQENIFVSGLWKYQYYQYNQWHGPFQHQLVFNPMTRTLNGYGQDNVGQYVLNGSFSEVTGKIEMTQRYQIGTGNPNLNLGHQDMIQLSWDASRKVFKGIAYSQAGGCYIPGALIEMSLA